MELFLVFDGDDKELLDDFETIFAKLSDRQMGRSIEVKELLQYYDLEWRDDNDNRIKILSPHNLNYHCPMHNKVFEKIDQPFDASQYICYVHSDSQFFMTEKL